MTAARLALVAAVAALAVAALPGVSAAANECNGIPRCIPVKGPWVAVPIEGEAEYLLACPQGRGVVAGTDALASSQDVHVTFDGILGSPVAFGRTTGSSVLFRAVSGHHQPGYFQPYIGCIPAPSSVRNTTAAAPTPPGAPLDLKATLIRLTPGVIKTVGLSCPTGETLVDSWSATAFRSAKPPAPELALGVELNTRLRGRRAVLSISASEVLPATPRAEVQLGVRCASG